MDHTYSRFRQRGKQRSFGDTTAARNRSQTLPIDLVPSQASAKTQKWAFVRPGICVSLPDLACEARRTQMTGKAAKVKVSERQWAVLQELSRSRTVAKGIVQRALILVRGAQGLLNEQIAAEVGLNRQQVGVWRQRWRDAWDSLCVWECTEPHRFPPSFAPGRQSRAAAVRGRSDHLRIRRCAGGNAECRQTRHNRVGRAGT